MANGAPAIAILYKETISGTGADGATWRKFWSHYGRGPHRDYEKPGYGQSLENEKDRKPAYDAGGKQAQRDLFV
ncbi:hypothetical protein GCM10007426_01230 [Alloalcanivorax dieselolei]|nr:hypothetical protein GCM10007426_01230 [Alloalcanivorax dieselolei]